MTFDRDLRTVRMVKLGESVCQVQHARLPHAIFAYRTNPKPARMMLQGMCRANGSTWTYILSCLPAKCGQFNTQNQVATMNGLIASPTSSLSKSKDAVTITTFPLLESEGHKNGEVAMGTVAKSQVLDAENQVNVVYPSGVKLILIVFCLASSVFLVALVHDHHPTPPICASNF